jgi:hypothetical protein
METDIADDRSRGKRFFEQLSCRRAASFYGVVVAIVIDAVDGEASSALLGRGSIMTITVIASKSGATTASAVNIAGGAPLRLVVRSAQEHLLVPPQLDEFYRARLFEHLPCTSKTGD